MTIFNLFLLLMLSSCLNATKNNSRADNAKPPINKPSQAPEQEVTKSNEVLKSQAYRAKGAFIRTIIKEINANINGTESENYFNIPDPDRDNDNSVTYAAVPSNDCGLIESDVPMQDRLNDCQAKNPQSYFWDGTKNAVNGEGNWRLAYRSGSKQSWIDQSTGLLWNFDSEKTNWENASGSVKDQQLSSCTQEKIPMFQKSVAWRLPTRNEFLQADINGARFVLNTNDSIRYWSATSSRNKGKAWAIIHKTGELIELDQSTELEVKCIGTPLK